MAAFHAETQFNQDNIWWNALYTETSPLNFLFFVYLFIDIFIKVVERYIFLLFIPSQ